MEGFRKYIPLYLRICRSMSLYFLFVLISYLTGRAIGSMPLIKLLMTAFVLHTVLRIFSETDRETRDAARTYCNETSPHDRSSLEIWGILFKIKAFRLELLILLILSLLFPADLGLTGTLLRAGLSRLAEGILHRVILLIIMVILWGIGHYNGFFWWMLKSRSSDLSLGRALVLKLLGTAALYILCGNLALPYVGGLVITAINILLAFGKIYWWLPYLLAALPFLILFAYRFLRALRIRHAFIRRLRRLCRKIGATLSPIKRPYRSLFKKSAVPNFTVTHLGKTYHCLLIGVWARKNALYFSELGFMQCVHSINFRNTEYLSFTTQFDFSFDAPAPKILIVNPVSHEIHAGHTFFSREIDTGEKIGDYKVCTATGFLGALERNVLDR